MSKCFSAYFRSKQQIIASFIRKKDTWSRFLCEMLHILSSYGVTFRSFLLCFYLFFHIDKLAFVVVEFVLQERKFL